MLDLLENYKIKIINRYGKIGQNWLEKLENIVTKYQNQFELEEIHLIENLSINVVFWAKSKQYGDVVMKIGAPNLSSI